MSQRNAKDLDAFGEFGVPIHVIEKNPKEQIRISLNEFHGYEYIDVRSFYFAPDGFRPSRKGVTLPKALYGELLKGILELGGALGLIEQDLLTSIESGVPDSETAPARAPEGLGPQCRDQRPRSEQDLANTA